MAEIDVTIRLRSGGRNVFGPGKYAVLRAIAEHGSISAAGRALGMSYRRCWNLVDEMNAIARTPLVETQVGAHSGARLTALGAEVAAAYDSLIAASREGDGKAALARLADALAPTATGAAGS